MATDVFYKSKKKSKSYTDVKNLYFDMADITNAEKGKAFSFGLTMTFVLAATPFVLFAIAYAINEDFRTRWDKDWQRMDQQTNQMKSSQPNYKPNSLPQ